MLFAEIIGEQGNACIEKITGFDNSALDDFIEIAPFGKAFQHRHEIGSMAGLCAKLDLRCCLGVVFFPRLFHEMRSWPQ